MYARSVAREGWRGEEGDRDREKLVDVGKEAVVKKDWKPFPTLTAASKQNVLQETTGRWGAL